MPQYHFANRNAPLHHRLDDGVHREDRRPRRDGGVDLVVMRPALGLTPICPIGSIEEPAQCPPPVVIGNGQAYPAPIPSPTRSTSDVG